MAPPLFSKHPRSRGAEQETGEHHPCHWVFGLRTEQETGEHVACHQVFRAGRKQENPGTRSLSPGFSAPGGNRKTGEHVACHRVFPYPDRMIRTIEWTDAGVEMLDQRLLPA